MIEIEAVEGEPSTWRQSILFSNGWELALHFHDVKVEAAEALLPAPHSGAGGTIARVSLACPGERGRQDQKS